MTSKFTTVQIQGKSYQVPACPIQGNTVLAGGSWIKTASVMDEEFLEGEVIRNPVEFIRQLRMNQLKADIFTFSQKIPDVSPRHKYHYEWDNFAVIPITTYSEWWNKRVERDVRKAVNRATRLGVVVRVAELDDSFLEGIRRIYNESPVRQGKPFWHYQKDFETIKRENSTYRDRCICIGAYFEDELIGFIRMLRVGTLAMTLQVISMMGHSEKKPTNALIAKAVEVCEANQFSHLIYSRFMYNNLHSSLTEFKRRNGFEQVLVPKYYVPLTIKGSIAIRMGLHLPMGHWIPASILAKLKLIRSSWHSTRIQISAESL